VTSVPSNCPHVRKTTCGAIASPIRGRRSRAVSAPNRYWLRWLPLLEGWRDVSGPSKESLKAVRVAENRCARAESRIDPGPLRAWYLVCCSRRQARVNGLSDRRSCYDNARTLATRQKKNGRRVPKCGTFSSTSARASPGPDLVVIFRPPPRSDLRHPPRLLPGWQYLVPLVEP
jgi:hypothetical protein